MTVLAMELPTPQNLTAEQTLLGVLLLNNAAVLHVPQNLGKHHFLHPTHGEIFQKIREFFSENREANPITLKAEMTGLDGTYLTRLMAFSTGSVVPIADYCEVIHESWQKSAITNLCRDSLNAIDADSATNVAAQLSSQIESIMEDAVSGKIRTDYDIGVSILEDMKNDVIPTSTGISKLDITTGGGFFEKKLYGFAARKKVGKTVLAATFSHNFSQNSVKHLFICAEMSAKEIHQRILARLTDSYESAFRSEYGKSASFRTKLATAITESKRCAFYEDRPGITFEELKQILPVYAVRHKIKGFILDYWQLVGGKPKNKSTAEHQDDVAQWLATFCRRHNVWGVVMAQINQEGNTRGGEGLRLAADQVYEIHREDLSMPNTWIEMMETRYTPWANIGSKDVAGLMMEEKGPYFHE